MKIPAKSMPLYRRQLLSFLRHLPIGKAISFRIYRRIWREILGDKAEAETYYGAKMNCDLSDLIPSSIFHFGVWEPHISEFFRRHLRPGKLVCDIGANIGYYTLLASMNGADVVAVEPNPIMVEKLRRNIALNNLQSIRVIEAAVGIERCMIPFYGGPIGNMGMGSISSCGRTKQCDVICLPLSDVLPEKRQLSIIKIDVEGNEEPILSQIIDEIDSYPNDLVIIAEMSCRSAHIFSRLLELEFKAYAVQNSYDVVEEYLKFSGISPPRLIYTLEGEQQDVILGRQLVL